MFTDISWGSYITFMMVVCALYYLVIGFRFYRSDVLQLISGGKPAQNSNQASHKTQMQQAFEDQDVFQVAQSLADEIQAYLNEAARNRFQKEDVMKSLKSLIAKYPSIKDSDFREGIQNLIITYCEANCSIHLSEEELSELW